MVYYGMKNKHEHPKYAAFRDAMLAALAKIEEYYEFTTPVQSVATFLDPRASMYFFNTHVVSAVYRSVAEVRDSITVELGPFLAGPVVVPKELPEEEDDILGGGGLAAGTPHDELALYWREMKQPRGEYPLDW